MEISLLILVAIVVFFYFNRKAERHKNAIKALTSEEKQILQNDVLFYKKLTAKQQVEFENRMVTFLNQIQIIPYGCEVEAKDKVFIAASAIIPVFGFKHWEYNNISIIYLLQNAFNEDFEYVGNKNQRHILGMVGKGDMRNKMVLSQSALRHGFDNKTDKRNTAIHEFVHLIDMVDGDTDGLPKSIMEQPFVLPWLDLIHNKMSAIDEGDSDIRAYGSTSKVEFFAVASEYFFERPKLLKRKHPKLYKKLSIFFNQDLA